eukprot:1496672-Pyramimonas_sp.AAC.1
MSAGARRCSSCEGWIQQQRGGFSNRGVGFTQRRGGFTSWRVGREEEQLLLHPPRLRLLLQPTLRGGFTSGGGGFTQWRGMIHLLGEGGGQACAGLVRVLHDHL